MSRWAPPPAGAGGRIPRRRATGLRAVGLVAVVAAVTAAGSVGAAVWRGAGQDEPPIPTAARTSTPKPSPSAADPVVSATQRAEPTERVAPTRSAAPATSTTPTPTASGCSPGGGGVPVGADVRTVVDVDGDGRPDRAWLWDGGDDRRLGITTASGATFSVAIGDAAPVPLAVVVQRVQSDDVPVALVDGGRFAAVYSLVGCAVTELQLDARPYGFDRGIIDRGDVADRGTGVGCTEVGGVLRLARLDAERTADGRYDVSRTFVDLDADGRHGTNGRRVVVARGAAVDAPVVVTALEVSCGDLVAGRDGPVEPEAS